MTSHTCSASLAKQDEHWGESQVSTIHSYILLILTWEKHLSHCQQSITGEAPIENTWRDSKKPCEESANEEICHKKFCVRFSDSVNRSLLDQPSFSFNSCRDFWSPHVRCANTNSGTQLSVEQQCFLSAASNPFNKQLHMNNKLHSCLYLDALCPAQRHSNHFYMQNALMSLIHYIHIWIHGYLKLWKISNPVLISLMWLNRKDDE